MTFLWELAADEYEATPAYDGRRRARGRRWLRWHKPRHAAVGA